jgi:hypothetical protein
MDQASGSEGSMARQATFSPEPKQQLLLWRGLLAAGLPWRTDASRDGHVDAVSFR